MEPRGSLRIALPALRSLPVYLECFAISLGSAWLRFLIAFMGQPWFSQPWFATDDQRHDPAEDQCGSDRQQSAPEPSASRAEESDDVRSKISAEISERVDDSDARRR